MPQSSPLSPFAPSLFLGLLRPMRAPALLRQELTMGSLLLNCKRRLREHETRAMLKKVSSFAPQRSPLCRAAPFAS